MPSTRRSMRSIAACSIGAAAAISTTARRSLRFCMVPPISVMHDKLSRDSKADAPPRAERRPRATSDREVVRQPEDDSGVPAHVVRHARKQRAFVGLRERRAARAGAPDPAPGEARADEPLLADRFSLIGAVREPEARLGHVAEPHPLRPFGALEVTGGRGPRPGPDRE